MNLSELKTVQVDLRDRVLTLTLDNPAELNAIGPAAHRELSWVFRTLAGDKDCDVVILTGAGRAFCAGGNLEWMERLAAEPESFLPVLQEIKLIVSSMLELPQPLICRLNGDAVGLGMTLALCCDMIVASETARLGDPHVRVGLTAGDGAALILPHLIGHMRARELLLTGDLIAAEEARQMGIVNHVVPAEELDERVAKLATKLVRGAQTAIRLTKAAVNSELRAAAATQLEQMAAYEGLTIATADHRTALQAIREGKRPQFGSK